MEPAEYALMDAAEDRMWWYRALHARLLAALAPVRGTLLDAGCGTGGFMARLAAARPDLDAVGFDYNAAAARRAGAKSGRPTLAASVNALPFAPGRFDAVVSADVLGIGGVVPGQAVAEFHRVLRPGGLLVLNLPAMPWLMSAHDRRVHNARRFARGQAQALLTGAGFAAPQVRFWNALLLPLMVVQRKVLRTGADDRSDVAHFPPWQERILYAVTAIERRLPVPWPAGGSLLAVARRPEGPRA